MAKLHLTLACWNYDRVRALADGRVQPEGIEINFLDLPVEETFFRMLRRREFDAAEMSLSSYTMSLFADPKPFVAIPVFPSRVFRHSCIFISGKSGIREPKDLIGKRVGMPEYQMTAPVWMRGMLADEYGVPADSVEYFTGGLEQPGREEKLRLDLPSRFKVSNIGPEKTLSRMLAAGEIDALHASRIPSSMHTEPGAVRRLFENYVEVEQAYLRKTGIFPIMHAVAIKRELYERHPWIAMSLYKAFVRAKSIAYEEMYENAALRNMLPWMMAEMEWLKREVGDDWWSYGLRENRHVLETFLRYHHDQGLSKSRLSPEALFVPETFDSFKI